MNAWTSIFDGHKFENDDSKGLSPEDLW